MSYRVVWKFEQRTPAINSPPVQIEEADELWWTISDIAQLYAVLTLQKIGACGFRLESSDA